MIEREQLAALQTENARLLALLDGHGIEWRLPPEPPPIGPVLPAPEPAPSRFSTAEKVALFRRLFRGRTLFLRNHIKAVLYCVFFGSVWATRVRPGCRVNEINNLR
jgi:hypothetical protein